MSKFETSHSFQSKVKDHAVIETPGHGHQWMSVQLNDSLEFLT